MRAALFLGAMSLLGLTMPSTAQAQHYHSGRSHYNSPSYYPYSGYQSYNFGGSNNWNYNRGHYDYVPGQLQRHGNHYHYVPGHVDYHIGNRRYEVIQTPYGTTISPYSHRHR